MAEIAEPLGHATNNVAEWTAVRLALEEALRLGATHVDLRMDSELVARQISGIYRVKHPDLKPIHAAVMEMLRRLEGYTVGHVPRELNKDADRLSNVAIDGTALEADVPEPGVEQGAPGRFRARSARPLTACVTVAFAVALGGCHVDGCRAVADRRSIRRPAGPIRPPAGRASVGAIGWMPVTAHAGRASTPRAAYDSPQAVADAYGASLLEAYPPGPGPPSDSMLEPAEETDARAIFVITEIGDG